ncbi:IMPACT family protein [Flavobacterium ardleyense]|uniref:IMPACT family protein n=1 Tax=Flavobacterium ardleyense TaxID=2038737 RepID=UPI00298CC60C|nr:YigZ family protein [Flavobacterium ardleyense]
MEEIDTYNTIEFEAEPILFKEKNSKFFGYAFPIENEDDVKAHLEILRKKHPTAGHFCYAYQTGTDTKYFRANDDGEPSNSAGMPIYGQIQSFDVTNILIVVARIFGGTKLGVGGLISAYKTAAQLVLENSEIVQKTIDIHFLLSFDYAVINKVMRIIKEKRLDVISQTMEMRCLIEIATRKKNAEQVLESFQSLHEVELKIKE